MIWTDKAGSEWVRVYPSHYAGKRLELSGWPVAGVCPAARPARPPRLGFKLPAGWVGDPCGQICQSLVWVWVEDQVRVIYRGLLGTPACGPSRPGRPDGPSATA